MRILLVGTGGVGSVISRFLSRERSVSEIICASNDLLAAKEFIDYKDEKIHLEKVDASDTSRVCKIAKDVDLIINASLPYFNLSIMKAALKVGANYQDLCSYMADFKNPEQLKFHREFQRAGLLGLINTGISPGITNLLAREAADNLDRVSEIKIRLVEDQKTDELVFAWSPPVLIDEVTSPPLVYENGKFKLIKPFSAAEDYEFPYPFGVRRVVSISCDEVATIPRYISTKNVNLKSCGSDIDFFRMLRGLGLFSENPIDIGGKKIVPLEFFSALLPGVPTPRRMIELVESGKIEYAVFVIVVEVLGEEFGKKIKIKNSVIFPELKEISKKFPGATYISYPTGLSAVAFAKVVSNVKEYGVFPPETLNSRARKEILLDLENNGIIVREEFSKA